jgi:WXG100 family type VII secretion target
MPLSPPSAMPAPTPTSGGGLIKVTPEQLVQVAGQLNAGAGNIEAALAQLAAQVAPLGTDWAGVGQARFLELWAEWQRGGAQLREALTGIAGLMAQAATTYQSGDQGVAASFSRGV